MKREEEDSKEKYPWLDDKDERKYMIDKEILDKYINLDNSCLTKAEKKEVRELIYEYKDAFSLRDEIGMCPNIEVEIDVTDKTHSSSDHFMQRKKIKHFGQRNEKTELFRYFERRLLCLMKSNDAPQ